MNKKMCKIFTSIFVILLLVSLVVSQETSGQTTNDYDSKKPQTWITEENFNKFQADLTDETKVKIINNELSKVYPGQREYIFDRIIELIYKEKLDRLKADLTIRDSAISLAESKQKGSGEDIKKFFETQGITERKITEIENFIGFDNTKLKFLNSDKGKIIIGDGNVWLDLENIPEGISSITYDGNQFILGSKNNGKIVIENGGLNLGDIKGIGSFNNIELVNEALDKNAVVKLTKNGIVIQSGGKISFDGKILAQNDKSQDAVFRILSKDIYKVKNGEVIIENLISIKTPGDKETFVNFGSKGDLLKIATSDDQVVSVDKEQKTIEANGKGIVLTALGDLQSVAGKGNVVLYDGKIRMRFDDKEVYGPRLSKNDNAFLKEVELRYTMAKKVSSPLFPPTDFDFDEKVYFKIEDGKVAGFKGRAIDEWVSLDKNKNDYDSIMEAVEGFGSENKRLIGSLYHVYNDEDLKGQGGLSILETEAKNRRNGQVVKTAYNDEGINLPVYENAYSVSRVYNLNNEDLDFEIRQAKPNEGNGKGYVFDRPPYIVAGILVQTSYVYKIAKNEIRIPKEYKDKINEIRNIKDPLQAREKLLEVFSQIQIESRTRILLPEKPSIKGGGPITKQDFLDELPKDPVMQNAVKKGYVTQEDLEQIKNILDAKLTEKGISEFPKDTLVRFVSFPQVKNPDGSYRFTKIPEVIITTPSGKEYKFEVKNKNEQEYLRRFLYAGFAVTKKGDEWPRNNLRILWCEKLGKPTIPDSQIPNCE
ncbi:MAG: hypothetical protein Q8N99_04855 [Nanoarchaeota archaeon]|nr:hypothetical protein [Nanoarchaeota archaeon]